MTILGLQLVLSVRRQSQTWDEGNHIFAGYMSSMRADFGLNPEHPPMLKVLATAPLLSMPLKVPSQLMLGNVLKAKGQPEEARSAYEKALMLAKTVESEFQVRSIPSIEQKLAYK